MASMPHRLHPEHVELLAFSIFLQLTLYPAVKVIQGPWLLSPLSCNMSHKIATECGSLYFMFLGPLPSEVPRSVTDFLGKMHSIYSRSCL